MLLTSSVMGQMMARFRNFYSLQKVKIWLKKAPNSAICFEQIYLREKNLGVGVGAL